MKDDSCSRVSSASSFSLSVLARRQTLLDALNTDAQSSPRIVNAVRNTTSFANWEWTEKGIFRMGRNTLRKVADEVLIGCLASEVSGWKYLDALRRSVKIKSSNPRSRRSVSAQHDEQRHQNGELVKQLKIMETSMAIQTKAYLFLFQQLQGLAKNGEVGSAVRARIFNMLNEHDELYGEIFGPGISDEIRPKNVEVIQR